MFRIERVNIIFRSVGSNVELPYDDDTKTRPRVNVASTSNEPDKLTITTQCDSRSQAEPTTAYQPKTGNENNVKRSGLNARNMLIMVIVSCVLVAFVFCWIPYMLALFLYAAFEDHCGVDAGLLAGLSTLLSIQSIANFLIYVAKDKCLGKK